MVGLEERGEFLFFSLSNISIKPLINLRKRKRKKTPHKALIHFY